MSFFDELRPRLEAELGQKQAHKVCEIIALDWGGSRVYIPVRFERIEIRPDDTPTKLARRYKVTTRTGANWMNKWRQ